MSGAKVAWSYQAGIYHFTIDEAGTRFSIQFTTEFLLRKCEDDLEEEIHKSLNACCAKRASVQLDEHVRRDDWS